MDKLLELNHFTTGLKIQEFYMKSNIFSKHNRESINNESYVKLQRDKAFFNFIVKHRYDVAKTIFQEFDIPLHEVVEIFKWVFPQELIDNLHSQFEVHAIPYHDKIEDAAEGSAIQDVYVKPKVNPKQMLAIKTFMPYFKVKLE